MRTYKAIKTSVLCAAVLLAASAAGAAGPGTSAADFLKIPVGARETALGGAFTSIPDGPGSVLYNPAGLGLAAVPGLTYSYNDYLPGISQHWLAGSLPAGGGAVGFGLDYLDVNPFASYDNFDNRTGSVSAYDMAVYLGYGRGFRTGLAFLPSLYLGASLKSLKEKLASISASGYAADAGLLLPTSVKGLGFGLAARNLAASRLSFIGSGARPASEWKAGASYSLAPSAWAVSFLASADLNLPKDGSSYFSGGLEGTFYRLVSLRAGYSSYGDISNGLSFGLGLLLPSRLGRRLRLDYSYASTYDLGNMQRFGVSCAFGGRAGRKAQAPAAAPPAPEQAPAGGARPPAAAAKRSFDSALNDLYGQDPVKSLAAAEYIAGLNDPRAMQHFSALLSSGRTGWQIAALRGLELSKDPLAVNSLCRALGDQKEEIRAHAALALASHPGHTASACLQAALRGENSDMAKSAIITALGRINTPGGTDAH